MSCSLTKQSVITEFISSENRVNTKFMSTEDRVIMTSISTENRVNLAWLKRFWSSQELCP